MRLAQPPLSRHGIANNLFLKMMQFERRGDCNQGHKHNYDHLTVLSRGAIEVHCDGRWGRFRAPHLFLTPKGKLHQFFALENDTMVTCVHALRRAAEGDQIVSGDTDPKVCNDLVRELCVRESSQDSITDHPHEKNYELIGTEHEYGTQVLSARCANTTVTIHKLQALGDRQTLVGCATDAISYLGFLAVGSVWIHTTECDAEYTAPYLFVLPKSREVDVRALESQTVFVELQTHPGAEIQGDTYHPAITLDVASERMQAVLREIDEQTTVARPYQSLKTILPSGAEGATR